MISQSKSLRKTSGGMKKSHRKKKFYDRGGRATLTKVGKTKSRVDGMRGGRIKSRLLKVDVANVYDPKEKKFKKASIKNVLETPANRHYARANVVTAGAFIDTDIGRAKVTSRPGQEGFVNATLVGAVETKKTRGEKQQRSS